MLILLPPSEAKRDGGVAGSALDLSGLSFPALAAERRRVMSATRRLSRNSAATSAALGLGPKQRFEIERNRTLRSSPVMPAIDRYSGVLYDALAAGTLSEAERAFAADHVVIHSALFGLIRASDAIPAYRLSHGSRLPDLRLKQVWRRPISAILTAHEGLILDLRSEAYAELGPIPGRDNAVTVTVVTQDVDGHRRSLNHFNKHGKGMLLRALIQSGESFATVGSVLDWATVSGLTIAAAPHGAGPRNGIELVFD